MSYTADFLIQKRKEKWAEKQDIEYDKAASLLQALAEYSKVKITGVYAETSKKRYNYGFDDETGQYRWYEIKPKNADGTDNWYYQNEQEVTKTFGLSPAEFWNNRDEYSAAYRAASHFDEPYFETVKHVLELDTFASYAVGLSQIYADKDSKGNSINGSRKKKVKRYIYDLNIPDIEKHMQV